jgi:hypothetical protein
VRREDSQVVGYAIAGIGPIALGALLTTVRSEVDNANLALIMVLVVLLAAVTGGRGPGLLAAVVATLSYDFFLTRPYLSLTIDSADDVETTVILLVIGLVVGQIAVGARRSRSAAARGSDEVARLHRVAERAASGAPVDDIVADVCDEIAGLLDLRECRFERPPFGAPLPRLERNGAISGLTARRFVGAGFALPEEGVELPVVGRGRQVGRFVLEPEADHGAPIEELVVAVALADQLGATIAAAEGEQTPG